MILNKSKYVSLIDTGSTVSTISEGLYKVLNIPLHPINDLLKIEAATGDLLPYKGYVECDLYIPDLNIPCLKGLFLVVPDTPFSKTTPVIIGTNLLRHLIPNTTLQDDNPWKIAFQCMTLHDQLMCKSKGKLALVKSANQTKS